MEREAELDGVLALNSPFCVKDLGRCSLGARSISSGGIAARWELFGARACIGHGRDLKPMGLSYCQ